MGDCEKVRRCIADYRTGNLDSGKTRWLAGHLAECRECARELEALDGVLTVGSGGTLTFGPSGLAATPASSPAMEPLASVAVSAVPEPGTLVLILAGLAALGLLTLRRRIGG